MMRKSVAPALTETAFDCPYCGAYTTQHWQNVFSEPRNRDSPTPFFPDDSFRQELEELGNDNAKATMLAWYDRLMTGEISLETKAESRYAVGVENLHLSKCYNCAKIAVWIHDQLVFPTPRHADPPNTDLPDDVARDFDEARAIVNESPRGAAALLRLCVQKLCIHLGESGKSIDQDIASLVRKGLNPIVQKSLDVVRVIGNESVHPGSLDLRDDRDTAFKLFKLVNLITDQMISTPKSIDELYASIPENKRKGIEARDTGAADRPSNGGGDE